MIGCNKKDLYDIENWDISFNNIHQVELMSLNNQHKTITLSTDESKLLIESFNNINKNDLYKIDNELMYVMFPINLTISQKNKNITINILPMGMIRHNGMDYYVDLNTEFFDLLRDINKKYDMKFYNWDQEILYYESYTHFDQWLCFSADITLKKLYDKFGITTFVDDSITVYDIINDKDLESNDVVEIDNMRIKVMDIKNGKITIVAIRLLS